MVQRESIESTPQYHINIMYDSRKAAFPHSSKWMFETTFVNHFYANSLQLNLITTMLDVKGSCGTQKCVFRYALVFFFFRFFCEPLLYVLFTQLILVLVFKVPPYKLIPDITYIYII